MCPPAPRSSAGSSALVTRSAPRTLVSYIACQSAGSACSTGSMPIAPPALLTSTSTSDTDAARSATDDSDVTSRVTGRIPGVEALAPPSGRDHGKALGGQPSGGGRPDPAAGSGHHCDTRHG